MRLHLAGIAPSLTLLALAACARAPSPLWPVHEGSIGVPHRGVLVGGAMLPRRTETIAWLRNDDRHWGLPRFVRAIEDASRAVAAERPGAVLVVGDLSLQHGGVLLPHLSHRTGRDVDLLLYMTTLEGAPVESPGFIHVGEDGLAWDEGKGRFLRFDVAREWILVRELARRTEWRVQWIFASHIVEGLLVEWARAKGEPTDIILRAMDLMLEPKPGGAHDDHLHVRTACAPEEIATGCEPTGPARAWLEGPAQATDQGLASLEP